MARGWGMAGLLVLAVGCAPGRPGPDGGLLPPPDGGEIIWEPDGGPRDQDGGTVVLPSFEPRWPPLQQEVEHFRIDFPPSTAAIVYDLARGQEYAPGSFTARGKTWAVELRQRGDGARYHPKHSWKVKLPDGTILGGARRLNFLAEYLDGGYLTDPFAYRLMQAAGVPAPTPRLVQLTVNGEYQGLYVWLEQVDKHFLRAHGLDDDSTIYRCGARDCEFKLDPPAHYQKPWEKKTNESEPNDDLEQFLEGVSRVPDDELERFLATHLELDAYLRYLAVNALVSNYGIDDSGSYFLRDAGSGRWVYVPWDLNNSRMLFWRSEPVDAKPRVGAEIPAFTSYDPETVDTFVWKEKTFGGAHRPFSTLKQRIWDRPALRHRVLDHLEELLATVFRPAETDPQIDALHALVRPHLAQDPWVEPAHARRAPEYLKEYVRGRRDFLAKAIARERTRGQGGVVIRAVGGPGAKVDDRGERSAYVELYNRGDTAVPLGGKVLTDVLRDEFRHRLPQGLVIPPKGSLFLWADGQPTQGPSHLPFAIQPGGGELGLFDGKTRYGALDVVYYPRLGYAESYRRVRADSEDWLRDRP